MKNLLIVNIPGWLEVVFHNHDDGQVSVAKQGGWGSCGYGPKYPSLDDAIAAQLKQIAAECGQVWADNSRRLFNLAKLRETAEKSEAAIFQDMMLHHDSFCEFPKYRSRVSAENAASQKAFEDSCSSKWIQNKAERLAREELELAAPMYGS